VTDSLESSQNSMNLDTLPATVARHGSELHMHLSFRGRPLNYKRHAEIGEGNQDSAAPGERAPNLGERNEGLTPLPRPEPEIRGEMAVSVSQDARPA
jgi:hypothetical protein